MFSLNIASRPETLFWFGGFSRALNFREDAAPEGGQAEKREFSGRSPHPEIYFWFEFIPYLTGR
jgi:hypothetical protein